MSLRKCFFDAVFCIFVIDLRRRWDKKSRCISASFRSVNIHKFILPFFSAIVFLLQILYEHLGRTLINASSGNTARELMQASFQQHFMKRQHISIVAKSTSGSSNHGVAVDGIHRGGMESATRCGMESMRSIVWNQAAENTPTVMPCAFGNSIHAGA